MDWVSIITNVAIWAGRFYAAFGHGRWLQTLQHNAPAAIAELTQPATRAGTSVQPSNAPPSAGN